MEGTLQLQILGTVQVKRDGEPVRGFRSRKALALLGYLAAQDKPVPREHLVDLLWGNKSEARGRANLSWVLNRISTLLPGCLQADRHTVQFQRAAAPYWLDIVAFEELEAQGNAASLAAAVELYRGEFLEGLYLDGCAEFEIWLVGERERWRQRVARLLEALVTHHTRRGEYQHGLHFAQRLLALEPWQEETHRQVMRLLAYSGQRGAALAQYETCRRVLAEELGLEPSEETTRLYERIRDGELRVREREVRQDLAVALPPFLTDEEMVENERPVFVVRERELTQLNGFLDQALAEQGRVVFVTGDAGSGKTALVQEFARRAQAAHPDLVVASGNGNAHTGVGDPYLPFREILALLTGDVESRFAAGATPREQARRLWQTLPLASQSLVKTGPDLVDTFLPGAALVERAAASVPDGADWLSRLEELVGRTALRQAQDTAAAPGDPNLQQSALFEQYTQVVKALARQRPLLVVLDDLQWADAGSTSLLFQLGRRIEGSRVLVVGVFRPEEVALGRGGERHPLEPVVNELKRHFGDIEVDLGKAEGRQFVEAFLDAEPNCLDGAFRETLYRQTGGHALYTIELLRGMQERGDLVQDQEGRWLEGPALDWETLPARVEAVIAERIGRLPERLQNALAMASVEGETFTAEVVAQVGTVGEREIVRWLSGELDKRHRLVSAQGVLRRDSQHLSLYRFRHILFQKYLYGSLDPVERAHLHQAVGSALEALHRGETEEIAVQLARHFQEAGITAKAMDYLQRAGARAVQMSAHEEAIGHFNQALALLRTLPDTPERAQQELGLQVALLVPLQAARGPGAPELGRTCDRARELCEQASSRGSARGVGETPQVFTVLAQLVNFYELQGEHQTAHEIGKQLLSMAERAGDPLLLAWAHFMLGMITTYLGEFARAQAYLEHAIAFYDPQLYHPLARSFGPDIGVCSLSFASAVLWLLGYPEQGLKRSQEAIALAHELSHPYSLAMAHGLVDCFHTFRRDAQSAQKHAEACIRLSTEHRFPYCLAMGHIWHGWALAEQGQVEEGMAEMRQGIADYYATGAELAQPQHLSLLVEACGKAGQIEEGLALLAEALAATHRNGERWCEAKLYWLKGELLRMQGADEAEVEACFHQAIEVARQQQARSWELRATLSLCRLWQEQGKREEARQVLAEIYGWFTEGFDTSDLKEARALLEELS